jgi:hypothetical protein
MSRMIAVNIFSPLTSTSEMAASIGNSHPSARRPWSVPSVPIERDITELPSKPSRCCRSGSRSRSGVKLSIRCPIASEAGLRNIFSAAPLNNVIRRSRSTLTTASMAEWMMPASRASLSELACSARDRCSTPALRRNSPSNIVVRLSNIPSGNRSRFVTEADPACSWRLSSRTFSASRMSSSSLSRRWVRAASVIVTITGWAPAGPCCLRAAIVRSESSILCASSGSSRSRRRC